ncbi:TatD family hydrolase [Virgisporangium aurantiacum]|uniref:AraC family transcriptional regulator n=1 Tax=Virgisporangium aurantiacum TaxID=175570 RepID=A0A8J4DXI2_9ACTN|nr:TatD family hydrolase [Virgisporangium aurantiacum]GIJ53606.1 AraC family transcriptional regulator [Virgisporangium aurantiacum]
MNRRSGRREGGFPPVPPALPVPVVDSHTHLDIVLDTAITGSGAPPSVAAAVEAARSVGVDRLVQVGVDVETSRWGVATANEYPEIVATVAVHPNAAPRLSDVDAALRAIDELAADPRVRGIGETGLDTFRTGDEGRKTQEESFRGHIEIAKRHGKPLVIHDRDAHTDILRVLDETGAPDVVVMHCFSGDVDFARECVRRGFVLSYAGVVSFANATSLRVAAAATPLDRILVETDAPYLTPAPHRGRPNAPYLIPLTVRALAEATGTAVEPLCEAISANGERVFGPW